MRLLLIIFFGVLSLPLYSENLMFKEEKSIASIFKDNQVQGTFTMYSEGKTLVGYNSQRARTRFVPASTFKIANSLIGLATGAVKSVDEVFFHYDGKPLYLKTWEKDMSLREAISVSNVVAYQELARKIGLKAMQENVKRLQYGNQNIGKVVDQFWLKGPLQITAIEQVEFLMRLAQYKLPYSKQIQKDVRDILKLGQGKNWTLYGKTGWATENLKPTIGWFVGWLEQKGKIYTFALNMDIKDSSELNKRQDIAIKSLKALGLM